MNLIQHLDELRFVILRCICAVIVLSIPCGIYWQKIFNYIAIVPLRLTDPMPKIIYTAPTEGIMMVFRIAVTGGFILASPFIFQQVWSFVAPALYKKEKTLILSAVFASTICFGAGIAYCYFLLPLFLQFLNSFAAGEIEAYFKVNEYFGFLIRTCIIFGLTFELPVIAIMLRKMKIIDHKFLLKYFRHAIVLIFIVAAILTPPDVLSQLFLALPLLLLYVISVTIVYYL